MPERAFATTWARFQKLDTLIAASETVEGQWRTGRSAYLAFLVPIDDPLLAHHISEIVRQIEGIPGVDTYPPSYWHMTAKGAGFEVQQATKSDEVPSRDVAAIAGAARSVFADVPAFEARIGLPNGFPEVVFLEVWDAEAVRLLNTGLMAVAPQLTRYPFDGDAFLPHISIARFTSSVGLQKLKLVLDDLRGGTPGPQFKVDHIDLVRAHLHDPTPAFETIESYALRS